VTSSAILNVVPVRPQEIRFSVGFEAASGVVGSLTPSTPSLRARGYILLDIIKYLPAKLAKSTYSLSAFNTRKNVVQPPRQHIFEC